MSDFPVGGYSLSVDSQTNAQLLSVYARQRSEQAFSELVRRHVDLVYSVALRMVRDSHTAQDVTQAVFVALAHNSDQLVKHPLLSGWLYRTTQNVAAQTIRTNARRHNREQQAFDMTQAAASNSDSEWEWAQIEPHLDTALNELSAPDRDALLLRYFDRKSAREIGELLGVSPEAAQKRVHRAIERLREILGNRSVTVSSASLAAMLAAHAVHGAPVGLALAVSSSALAAESAIVATATHTFLMTATQKALATAAVALSIGFGVHQAQQASASRAEANTARQEQRALAARLEESARSLAAAQRELDQLRRDAARVAKARTDLVALRAEAARLKADADAAIAQASEMQSGTEHAPGPPVQTFVTTSQVTATWHDAIVTGGWRLPSGRRALVLASLDRGEGTDQLLISSKIIEFSEEAGERLGLDRFNTETDSLGQQSAKTRILNHEETNTILAAVEAEDVDLLSAPRLTTMNGRHARIQVLEAHTSAPGTHYTTGPTLDFIPTISADGESVHVVLSAQLNYPTGTPAKRAETSADAPALSGTD